MLIAALVLHANSPFGKQELSLLYGSIYFANAIAEAGIISIDNWIYTKIKL